MHSAKINTLGARAEDTFCIGGEVLEKPQQQKALCDALRQQLA